MYNCPAFISGVDFKMKTVTIDDNRVKLAIWVSVFLLTITCQHGRTGPKIWGGGADMNLPDSSQRREKLFGGPEPCSPGKLEWVFMLEASDK